MQLITATAAAEKTRARAGLFRDVFWVAAAGGRLPPAPR